MVFLNVATEWKGEEIDNAFTDICQNDIELCDKSPYFVLKRKNLGRAVAI